MLATMKIGQLNVTSLIVLGFPSREKESYHSEVNRNLMCEIDTRT
jgi:hypothetical protein